LSKAGRALHKYFCTCAWFEDFENEIKLILAKLSIFLLLGYSETFSEESAQWSPHPPQELESESLNHNMD
jgi:hypothetical protein